ncbi:putative RNA polymerase II mediator complex component Srb8 [Amniculicola lignicola CBS 123094]|uniref:Putative RNA polymerase II mediator complex component Srb8 n=1 Tax=Amniculicola lignicola CBS 123094 TaxID=1392246 RepID=A0A6A5WBH9_9PLEO|nr:putative RNA polymerase II mediator complex component Srb8 [Amniculicola lignicola CBS 123094]
MAILTLIFGVWKGEKWPRIALPFIFLFIYLAANFVYNLYFHPLARRFPGPKLWAASRLPYIYALMTGNLVRRHREFHKTYGHHVRIAPDEVSFSDEQSWNDIYAFRKGHKRALRDKTFLTTPNEEVDNIITTNDPKFHVRVRTLLSNSFTEAALRAQHPIIQRNTTNLVSSLKEIAQRPPEGNTPSVVNITDWVNFYTMDVVSDLAFGRPFGCLENGEYHEWVRTLFTYLKFMTLAGIPRYYPLFAKLLESLIPKSIAAGVAQHQRYADMQISKRLDTATNRPDFMTPFMKNNANSEIMSRKEILATFNFVIVGGQETTATVLTGLFTHIAGDKRIRKRLCDEVRGHFKTEADITIDATKDLVYLDAVLNEGLRMCNPVPCGLPRKVPPGGDTYCGVHLPGGRWLPADQRPKEFAKDRLTASRPFSVGFHSCLGKPLAWVELRLVITRILWMFDLSPVPGKEVHFDDFPILLMVQKGPVPLQIKVRDDLQNV